MPEIGHRGASRSDGCANCPCARAGQPVRPVPAHGAHGGLCVIAESPGSEESRQGFPMIGPSGKILSKALKLAGRDRALVWITNAMLCQRPTSDDDMYLAMTCCRSRLQADLEAAQPTAICALGGTAMQALELPVTAVSQARGTVQYTPLLPNVPVIGSIHPAALLRGGAGEMTSGGKQKMNVDAQAQFLFSDIAKTAAIAAGEVSPEWSDDIMVIHELADVREALEAILADIYAEGVLGLDLEWTHPGHKSALEALGDKVKEAQITWVGVGCAKRAVSFKWDALVESGEMWRLQEAMEDAGLAKLSHNKQADKSIWEAQVGPINGRYLDTMLMHHCACPGIDHDLQQVVSQFLCVPSWKVEHSRQIADHAKVQKVMAKAEKKAAKEAEKAQNKADHDARNAALKAEKLAKKAAKKAEHEARNAKLKADKEARKVAKKGEM